MNVTRVVCRRAMRASCAVHGPSPLRSRSLTASTESPGKKPPGSLSPVQREWLESALRVNQAGELAAILIYAAQTPVLTRREPSLRPLMQHMYDQEVGHFTVFSNLLRKHRIRPTVLYPVWRLAASFLGWSTAVMSKEAAMACTEAVETEIGGHYNGQIRKVLEMVRQMEENGQEPGEELRTLLSELKRIRDEELEHLNHAVEEHSRDAKGFPVLFNIVKNGCKGAIWLSQRI